MICAPVNIVQTRVYCVVRMEDWGSLGAGLIRSHFVVTPLWAEGSNPVAPIISRIAHVGNVFPVEDQLTQFSSYGCGVAAQSEAA